ncbi:MAG: bifunctional oligoribonuclease/PAP phosphatase NrnA, partial [Lachnospiraceae bacterium]|nr:bifunctional oligoribonuclease/PAP phosphatase NrnA [Lachnospiraceae bacterium]
MNSEALKQAILDEIRAHDTIILTRHSRPDGDAVGSTMGLAEVLRTSFPGKRVFLDNEDYSDFVAFLGDEGPHPSDKDYEGALVIALDSANIERLSNTRVKNGGCLVKIDHHIDARPYGDISWVEDDRSAACEMIVDLCMTFPDVLKLNRKSATALYTGMVTDSGRFKYDGTDARSLRAAAVLLEQGIDIQKIYANLYMDDYSLLLFEAELISRIRRTENGVAWLYITKALREEKGLSLEDASNTVSLMDKIKGSMIWLAFIEYDDGSIRVRLRSRFVDVETLAGKYGGGGHANASGATVWSREEADRLIADADGLLGRFKAENP